MAKGRFNIKGTKDFLVAAVLCIFLCIWAIRDAWFPTQKTLKKHPQRIEVAFKTAGVVKSIPVQAGDEIQGETLLGSLYEESQQEAVSAAEKAFQEAKAAQSDDVQKELDALLHARAQLAACSVKNTDFKRTTSHGEEALRGVVIEVLADPATRVEVLRAESAGTVFKVTDEAILVSQEGVETPVKYLLDGFAPTVREGDEVLAGAPLAGTPIVAVTPQDTFYIFNKTLAVFSFFGAIVFFILHGISSR